MGTYYEDLVANDIVDMMKPLLDANGYKIRWGDGKLHAELMMAHETPWHHIKHDGTLDCHTWHAILFDVVYQRTGKKYVPIKCQECWKVVVRPKTLLGLFALEAIQKQLNRPSKCGIEVRETVHGLYGGYFYNHSRDEGLECYRVVRAAVDAEPLLGPDTKVLLKRACTEFEMKVGPSDEWEITDEQRHIEALIDRWVVQDPMVQEQPDYLVNRIHRRWIEFAFAAGDETYAHFTDGKPVHPDYVTYHHLAEESKDDKPKKKK
jgi:hypothetical protein